MPEILHTGGAVGTDTIFAERASKNGMKVFMHSFYGHCIKRISECNVIIHSQEELMEEAYPHYEKANRTLNRNIPNNQYVLNLILRDYFQIKSSELVFAVSRLISDKIVKGGTGYTVQMAIDNNVDVVIFDMISNLWHRYSFINKKFIVMNGDPPKGFIATLKRKSITGIGSRDITEQGKRMIELLF